MCTSVSQTHARTQTLTASKCVCSVEWQSANFAECSTVTDQAMLYHHQDPEACLAWCLHHHLRLQLHQNVTHAVANV